MTDHCTCSNYWHILTVVADYANASRRHVIVRAIIGAWLSEYLSLRKAITSQRRERNTKGIDIGLPHVILFTSDVSYVCRGLW